ncbi:MAG TPA: histidine--tRNA ligase [bacterium]|jgi:histidyl-tRNA synthetase|nr:MAG: Histidine--tRNA ligase [bacterium ADurb.Bin270]HPW44969.1 histidine--tRNA ligase [bacterium]
MGYFPLILLASPMAKDKQIIRAIKGMVDVIPPSVKMWQRIEKSARRIFSTYGYYEIRTPIVENTDLFVRGVGESSSIVEKEMYSFVDQGDDKLTLRPEGTAPVVRAYIESNICHTAPLARFFYIGPMFRRERPQKGRQRQFYQIGCELFDVKSPMADAEVIAMADHFLKDVGAEGLVLEINSIGCPACRPQFNSALVSYFESSKSGLCGDCARRLGKNPMRILDCKNEGCKKIVESAPRFPDFWCDECVEHFNTVKETLNLLEVGYTVNDRIVRGLDYYMRTTFEFLTDKLGSQNAVLAGGRYDGLVKELGGPDLPGIGFALGMERLVLLLEQTYSQEFYNDDVIYFAVLGDKARDAALPMIQILRKDGVRVEWDYASKSLKSQMKRADKLLAKSVVIIGEDEIQKGHAIVRDMQAGSQKEVRLKDLPMHFIEIGG